jgi:uncharacterized membrane protein YjgN (DUF898 family)
MEEEVLQNNNFVLSYESESFLKETAKWGYFLSILGFVFIGIMVLFAIFMGAFLSKLGSMGGSSMENPMSIMGNMGGFMAVIYLIIALIYFFPVYYLYLFSSKAKAAFKNSDNEQLNESFQFLKSHYKFIGIMALIMVSFYGIFFLFAFLIGMTSFL